MRPDDDDDGGDDGGVGLCLQPHLNGRWMKAA